MHFNKFLRENKTWCPKEIHHHGCKIRIEKFITRDHCSASLGKPRDAEHDPCGLSTPHNYEI